MLRGRHRYLLDSFVVDVDKFRFIQKSMCKNCESLKIGTHVSGHIIFACKHLNVYTYISTVDTVAQAVDILKSKGRGRLV